MYHRRKNRIVTERCQHVSHVPFTMFLPSEMTEKFLYHLSKPCYPRSVFTRFDEKTPYHCDINWKFIFSIEKSGGAASSFPRSAASLRSQSQVPELFPAFPLRRGEPVRARRQPSLHVHTRSRSHLTVFV